MFDSKYDIIISIIAIIIVFIILGFTYCCIIEINKAHNEGNNALKECKSRCKTIDEVYKGSLLDDDNNLVCYCKPKLHIVNGIVR